jgi:hypothetical protein
MDNIDVKLSQRMLSFVVDSIRGLGILMIISPIFLRWFIHGDYERYIWLINGPEPFSKFGGGPFQLGMYIGLVVVGIILLITSKTIDNVKREGIVDTYIEINECNV